MCLCRSERTSFTNGNLKGSINAGRYTADYLQCGNLPYLAWKNAHNCADLSYRRIRRYLVWRLKRLEARDFSRVRIKFLIHYIHIPFYILTPPANPPFFLVQLLSQTLPVPDSLCPDAPFLFPVPIPLQNEVQVRNGLQNPPASALLFFFLFIYNLQLYSY